jgi:hypothetical protein
VPAGTQGVFASKFQVIWDKSKANLTVTPGNYYGSNVLWQAIDSSVGNNGRYWINVASSDLTNALPDTTTGKYFAILKFNITAPGYIPVSMIGTDFRYYWASGDSTSGVYVTTNPGAMVFYLGDFERTAPADSTKGDGKINATDLFPFSGAYWSLSTNPLYRIKYDIGPTNINGSYWYMPNPDNKIEFEDLVIFAIGYGKYGAGQLQQSPLMNKEPIIFSTGKMIQGADGIFRVPVNIDGKIEDLRAFNMTMNYNSDKYEYSGVEKEGQLNEGLAFLMGKSENNLITMDGAIIGGDAINRKGCIANILLKLKGEGNDNISIKNVLARNSSNQPLIVKFSDGAGIELPTVFGLSQNYPNPFNPSTTIKYQLPKTVKVTLNIYDITGRLVQTLVEGVQEAGYYSIEWKSTDYASGVYFYRLEAGEFTNVKKMVIIK